MNPDGTYVAGGLYNGFLKNPDGKFVVGGAFNGFKVNPDGSYVVGGNAQTGCKRCK
jgi:hypothetical protein